MHWLIYVMLGLGIIGLILQNDTMSSILACILVYSIVYLAPMILFVAFIRSF